MEYGPDNQVLDDMCTDLRVDMCLDMCVNKCVSMCVSMHTKMCVKMCIWMVFGSMAPTPTTLTFVNDLHVDIRGDMCV